MRTIAIVVASFSDLQSDYGSIIACFSFINFDKLWKIQIKKIPTESQVKVNKY